MVGDQLFALAIGQVFFITNSSLSSHHFNLTNRNMDFKDRLSKATIIYSGLGLPFCILFQSA
jgi:hypothetical protein